MGNYLNKKVVHKMLEPYVDINFHRDIDDSVEDDVIKVVYCSNCRFNIEGVCKLLCRKEKNGYRDIIVSANGYCSHGKPRK